MIVYNHTSLSLSLLSSLSSPCTTFKQIPPRQCQFTNTHTYQQMVHSAWWICLLIPLSILCNTVQWCDHYGATVVTAARGLVGAELAAIPNVSNAPSWPIFLPCTLLLSHTLLAIIKVRHTYVCLVLICSCFDKKALCEAVLLLDACSSALICTYLHKIKANHCCCKLEHTCASPCKSMKLQHTVKHKQTKKI